MQFYQNQLNFVVWCTTTGCGVSYEHFNHENKLIRNFYRFHVYYQARTLLAIISCPAPFENYWKALENNIDMSAYKYICQQFHVSASSMWRQHKDNYRTVIIIILWELHIIIRMVTFQFRGKIMIIPV